jgi:hypothetical protein
MPTTIDDGYTTATFIKGIKGHFDDFYCERRPTLTRDRNKASGRAARAERVGDWDEHDAAYNELVAAKLSWWNVRDSKGKPAEITPANVALLTPALWDRLTNVALGFDAGDLSPDATAEEKAAFEVALAKQKAGEAPDQAQAEADTKN